jgi:hypothetical protein
MPPVEARPGWSYDQLMKARLFFVALICGAVAMSACLAAERGAAPAPATEGQAAAKTADHADGHQPPSPGGNGSVQTPPAAAGEPPGVDAQDKSASKALKPDAETPPAAPTHAHGSQPTGQSSHDDNARPSSPIDTRITVNQGRTLETNKKGRVPTPESRLDKASRTNAPKGIHVPPGGVRSGARHGPMRNAVGVAPDANAGAPRMDGTAFPGTGGAKTPLAGVGSSSSGVRPLPGAPPMGRMGSGAGASTRPMGHPMVPGAASINGTGMAHGALRVGEIGGPAKNNGGINGTGVRAKRP